MIPKEVKYNLHYGEEAYEWQWLVIKIYNWVKSADLGSINHFIHIYFIIDLLVIGHKYTTFVYGHPQNVNLKFSSKFRKCHSTNIPL